MRLLNISTGKIEFYKVPTDAPPYAAISYVWPKDASFKWTSMPNLITVAQNVVESVTSKRSSPISRMVNTTPFTSEWPIPSCSPESLNRALTAIYQDGCQVLDDGTNHDVDQLKPSPQFTHLWMDVLCLNQLNDKDKAEDVKHMKDYYSNAVCVWTFMNHLGEPDIPVTSEGPARWFTRLWTLQECVLPQKLYFYLGTSPTGKPDHAWSTRWVSRKHLISYIGVACGMGCDPIMKPKNEAEAFRWGLQLMPLGIIKPSIRIALLLSTVRECRFDVDRLYGIIGMLPQDKSLFDVDQLVMDYSKGFDFVSESFASALGQSAVEDFGFFVPTPAELKTATSADLKVSNKLGWFGNFEPGFYISGSVSHTCLLKELTTFITSNKVNWSEFLMFASYLKKPKNVETVLPTIAINRNPTTNAFEGVLLTDTLVTGISKLYDLGANNCYTSWCAALGEDRLIEAYLMKVVGGAMALIGARDKYLVWAVDERRRFLRHFGRALHMTDEEQKKWEEAVGQPFTGKLDETFAVPSGTPSTTPRSLTPSVNDDKSGTPKIGIFTKIKEAVDISLERIAQGIGMSVSAIFLYPPFSRDLNIITAEGHKWSGLGSYVDTEKVGQESGRLVSLLVTRTDTGTNISQSEMHVLARVLEEGDPAQNKSMVVRKLGVMHVTTYFAKMEGVEVKPVVGAIDFTKMNVVVM